jgi:phospholipid/cholesterol/gamma-HCH transport system substrate-binding protein
MKRRDEVLVGILMTVAITVGIIGTIWLIRGGLSASYPLYMKLLWGAGLKQGAPVFLSGVNVGYVGNVELREDGTLFVTLQVQKKYPVPEGTSAAVEPNGIFGDKLVALRPKGPNPKKIPPGDTLQIAPPTADIASILARVDTIGGRLSDMSRAIEIELVQGGGLADLRQTMAKTNQLVAQLSGIAAEQSRQMTATMMTLRRTVAAIDSASVDSTVRNLQRTSANVEQITTDLKRTTDNLNKLITKVDSGGGTAAKLLNDPGLYNDMRQLVQRLDSLTIDLKKNPKRYINLRVF